MRYYLLFIILIISSLNGETISSLIDQIKQSSPDQKRVLINRLKIKLKDENSKVRLDAINRLRSSLNTQVNYKQTTTYQTNHIQINSHSINNIMIQKHNPFQAKRGHK